MAAIKTTMAEAASERAMFMVSIAGPAQASALLVGVVDRAAVSVSAGGRDAAGEMAGFLLPLEVQQGEPEVQFRFLWLRTSTSRIQFLVGARLMKRNIGVRLHNGYSSAWRVKDRVAQH